MSWRASAGGIEIIDVDLQLAQDPPGRFLVTFHPRHGEIVPESLHERPHFLVRRAGRFERRHECGGGLVLIAIVGEGRKNGGFLRFSWWVRQGLNL